MPIRVPLARATTLLVLTGGLLVLAPPGPAQAVARVREFSTGTYDWVVPAGQTSLTVEAIGGNGDSVGANSAGRGARLVGTLTVTPGTVLHLHVGGNAVLSTPGANGGGLPGAQATSRAGGGATDIRIGADDLAHRVLVAGGGGGATNAGGAAQGGGDAGIAGVGQSGASGGDASGCTATHASGGSQVAGGAGGGGCGFLTDGTAGTAGVGGNGGVPLINGQVGGGGGGGGWYGGGGGQIYASGAGGSSYGDPALVTLSANEVSGAGPVLRITYDAVPGSLAISTDTALAAALPADGATKLPLTADLRDQTDQPFPGQTVSFTSTDPAVTFSPVQDGGSGTYTTQMTSSTTVHDVTVTATSGTVTATYLVTQVKASQALSFTSVAPSGAAVGGSYALTAAGGGSSAPLTLSSASPATCTVADHGGGVATVAFVHVGTCSVVAQRAGDANHLDAPAINQSWAIGLGSQVLTFASTAKKPFVGTRYRVRVTGAAPGLKVTISATPRYVCRVRRGVVSFLAVGGCRITAVQKSGSADYLPGARVKQKVRVRPAKR